VTVARAVVGRLPVPVADALRRRRLPGPLRRLLYTGGIPRAVDTFPLVDAPSLTFRAADSMVLTQLYWWGGQEGWEPELLPWWRAFCRQSRSILELGTNVGYFAVQGGIAAPAARYVAVEPHPQSVDLCRAHLALNGVTSVEVVAAAAVAEPARQTVALHVPADQLGMPTVAFVPDGTELPDELARDVRTVLEVPAVDVRSLVADAPRPPDLIKMDVEGQEHLLLAAIGDFLREHRPPLFVEVLPGTAQLRAVLTGLCAAAGYRCYAFHREGLVELSPAELATVDLMPRFGCQDVLLCAGELPEP
jgi:FkbM family methyltransferase